MVFFEKDLCNKNFGGIYCILNIINGKFYIGSTVIFWKRYKAHLNDLKSNLHHSIYLQRSFNKYGIGAFEFHILRLIDTKDDIYSIEQMYLDCLSPNNRKIGYNVEGHVFNKSKETIAKIVATRKKNGNSEKFKKHLENLNGRKKGPMPKEQKQKISNSSKGKVRSEQHKINNGKALLKPIVGYDWLGYEVSYYDSLKSCAAYYGLNKSTVCEYVGKKAYKGVNLVYLQKNNKEMQLASQI